MGTREHFGAIGVRSESGALAGIKVLDLTRMVAGPLCTQVLADLGAEVFKVERPGHGDDTRRLGPFLKDENGQDSDDSAYYLAYNRGKKSITVDITSEEGRAVILDLARRCDVLVENYKAGSLEKYGLGYRQMAELLPSLVYCSISGFGPTGPYAKRPAYDSITQGMAGLMSTNGQPEGAPGAESLRTAAPITDVSTGLYASTAITAALLQRQRTGRGQHVDIALFDSSVALNGHLAVEYLISGNIPTRVGNANPNSAPSEVFACADGPVMIAAGNDSQFANLCEALGLAEAASQDSYRTNTNRKARRQELHDQLEARTRRFTKEALIEALASSGVPAGAILQMDEVFRDPQVIHREMVVRLPHPRAGEICLLRSPIRMSDSPPATRRPPMLGEHTDEVLAGELGLTEDHIDRLRAQQAI